MGRCRIRHFLVITRNFYIEANVVSILDGIVIHSGLRRYASIKLVGVCSILYKLFSIKLAYNHRKRLTGFEKEVITILYIIY